MPNLLRWLVFTIATTEGWMLAVLVAWPQWGTYTDYGHPRAVALVAGAV